MTQPVPQLPLMVSIGGAATDDPRLTPGRFALPPGSVQVTRDVNGVEESLLTGGLIELAGEVAVRAVTIRVNVPTDHPLPLALGEIWAGLNVGDVVTISETHTARRTRRQYVNAEIRSNTLGVSLQASLTEAYYSGSIEARVRIEDEHGL